MLLTRRNRAARRGVAAVEFALIAPLFVTLTLGLYDLTEGLILKRRTALAAMEVAEVATVYALQVKTGQNQLTNAQIATADTAAFTALPLAQASASGGTGDYAIAVSSVVFDPDPANAGQFKARIVWTSSFQPGGPLARSCTTRPTKALSDATDSITTLPPELYRKAPNAGKPYPMLIVDISYTYRPLFSTFLPVAPTFFRSGYFMPLIGNTDAAIEYVGTSDPPPGSVSDGSAAVTVCNTTAAMP